MVNIGKFTIIERSQMGQILKEQELQLTGCTDVTCAVEVGKLLSARKILVGTVMKLGDNIVITGRLVDVEKGIAEFSQSQKAENQNDLLDAVTIFSKKLSNKIKSSIVINKEDEYISEPEIYSYKYDITAGFNYMTVLGDFGDLVKNGVGGSFSIIRYVIGNFGIGILGGYYTFSGKDTITGNSQ